MPYSKRFLTLYLTVILAACATPQPPRELLDARAAYRKAQSGPAARLAPAELYEAKVALNDAEQAFSDDPESENTYTLSYVAQRVAQRVESQANIKEANAQKAQASSELQKLQSEGLTKSQQELTKAREKLANQGQELASERKARLEAEKHAREALEKVVEAAKLSVKQDDRGTVIILPGSVLFESGQATLFALAQQKLALLAEQIKNQKTSLITIEGHTDSRGSPDTNMLLSQRRADSVRTYLVSQGIPSERIKAVGMGETRPLASNNTSEGRAQNRRVEIVIAPGEPQ